MNKKEKTSHRWFFRRPAAFLCAWVVAAATLLPSVMRAGAEPLPGVTTNVHNQGQTLDKRIAGLNREKLVKWLSSHETDDYYIGTPYPESPDGSTILGASGDSDRRNPNGDCAYAYGEDDYAGIPMMNCTGFVWHALYKASGQSYDYARANIPCYGDPGLSTTGCGRWALWLRKNRVEYKSYQADNTQALLHAIAGDSYVEKGDIIWFWSNSARVDDTGLPSTHAGTHHIGFFWGDENDRDRWWDSIGVSDFSGTVYRMNKIGQLDPKERSVSAIVIKVSGNYELRLRKTSTRPEITGGNRCYSLEGAVYGVYGDAACTEEAGRLTTGPEGDSGKLSLPKGVYYVKEITAPKGFHINEEIYTVDLEDDYTLRVSDDPGIDPVDLLLIKADAETGKRVPLGGAVLQGAKYRFRYYDVEMTTDPAVAGYEAKQEWIFQTDESGAICMREDQKVSGPDLPKDEDGRCVLPLGTLTVQEVEASEGYLLNEELYVVNTHMENNTVTTSNLPNDENRNTKEQVQRGDVSLRKLDAETQKKLAGISFEIIALDAGGNEIETHIVTTDANGFYSSANSYAAHDKNTNSGEARTGTWFGVDAPVDNSMGAMPYGTYRIREIPGRNNASYEMYEDTFEINANEVLITLGNIEDRRMPPEILTTATDGTTGNHVGVVSGTAVIHDVIKYRDLPREMLTFEGVLAAAESGEPLLNSNGEFIVSNTVEEITEKDGEITVTFTFDSTALAGRDVVVFERVLDAKGRVVASHEDPRDPPQTVHYPSIRTNAVDGQSGNKLGATGKRTTIIDTVDYRNLVPGHKYRIEGVIADKTTGGKVPGATAFVEFEPESENGKTEVCFEVDTSSLAGHSLVVFETLFVCSEKDGTERYVEVARHENINDEAQTVTYVAPGKPPENGKAAPARTGDADRIAGAFAIFCVSAVAAAVMAAALYLRKRGAGRNRFR